MKTIRVAFVGFWEDFNKADNFILDVLRQKYNVQIIDAANDENKRKSVQYLFYSDFSDEYLDYDCIRIFYTGENICPDMNACDYAIGFDYLQLEDRYIRYPLYLAMYEKDVEDMLTKQDGIEQIMSQRKFCSMVVSNAVCAAPARREFFEKLSNYRKVDSGGRYLNNIGCPEGVADKQAFQSQYKFSIAFENSSHPGYCTEKLIQGFAAKTVPIYWGDTTVGDYFEKESFINCHDYGSWDEVIEAVKRIDRDDELYMSMLQHPAADEQKIETQQEEFGRWLCHIVDQEYSLAYRRNLYGRCIAKENELKRKNSNQDCRRSLPERVLRRIYHHIFRHSENSGRKSE